MRRRQVECSVKGKARKASKPGGLGIKGNARKAMKAVKAKTAEPVKGEAMILKLRQPCRRKETMP